MRYYQISENRDYAMAKKLFPTLSGLAQHAINHWEMAMWDKGELSQAYENDNEIAQEIDQKFELVRKEMKKHYGDTLTLYRGISDSERGVRSDRKLFSWTSSKHMAEVFAGKRIEKPKFRPITDKEIEQALKRYENTGFTTFRGKKYKKNKEMPKYYDIYDRYNNFITDGDNLEREFKEMKEYYADAYKKHTTATGRVVKKEIPIDDIVWVLMGGNANEYIVKGHPE